MVKGSCELFRGVKSGVGNLYDLQGTTLARDDSELKLHSGLKSDGLECEVELMGAPTQIDGSESTGMSSTTELISILSFLSHAKT